MSEVEFSTRAYCKVILHAAKYPHEAVNGILVSKVKDLEGSNDVVFVDAIPLFHMALGLTPMTEVALEQIESYCSSNGLKITGYYQANEHYKNTNPNFVANRICEKISERFGQVHLAMVDNRRLSLDMASSAIIMKNRDKASVALESDSTCVAASCLLQNRAYRLLVDFDNHLDNVSADWRNPELNHEIDAVL
ncbi:ER membrane protein complex subunit 8-like [Amphibalanus amphitrite]|uniref:ER membrane protein complex subunit 8-like n=1 Tax=Amphibalanus amphitrite TaxID=1232801 RepID=UPI001C90861F|nr:ER membrane protein complex subunit 8-like [Amphibalanus amphitrite]XP_043230187.1 ER membrane protein complex subunit 8-like [Amphibalanus amphitrite]